MKARKLLFAALSAIILLAALTATSTARDLRTTATPIRATWTRMDMSGIFGTVECEVILGGPLHSTIINKIPNFLIGRIDRALVTRCARGAATVLVETLPWHITYSSFSGTLPNISSFSTHVAGASFSIEVFGFTCLFRSTVSLAFGRETAAGRIVSASVGGTVPCGGSNTRISGTTTNVENGVGNGTKGDSHSNIESA
jgi:hypothetical protein